MKYIFFWIFLFNIYAEAKVNIPLNLTSADRKRALQILGLGTSTKVLTDPYPLGGYSGFEVGLSTESITIDEISRLGSLAPSQDQFVYPIISIGKGVYNNLDFFLNFMPFNESTGLSSYGGFVRWGFYQMKFFPASFSLIAHANSSNINEQIISQSSGIMLMNGINIQNFSFYIGLGTVQSLGRFIGGINGITSEATDKYEGVQTFQSTVGGAYHIGEFFVALQLDQYSQSTYSFKLGYRN